VTKVFIGGSRKIIRLSASVTTRIENIISSGFTVLIGDANGADRIVQQYLAAKQYANVIVYCSGHTCRNNIGGWQTVSLPAGTGRKDFRFYALKDEQMAREADFGLMLWDRQSRGTLNNILNLLLAGKRILVFLPAEDRFYTIRSSEDVRGLLSQCDEKDLNVFEEKLNLSVRLNELRAESAVA
jgi:hypothetical protein